MRDIEIKRQPLLTASTLTTSISGQFIRLSLLAMIILLALLRRSSGAATLDDLYHKFQIDLPSADIAVLLDASRSMKDNEYRDVRQAIVDFVPALTDGENVHIRVFGDVVSNPLEGKGSQTAAAIEDHLPQEPLFNHTDLGLAISKGVEFLEREGASRVQALFLLTDGLHQPASGSPYSRDFADDPDWQEIERRAQALCRKRSVVVYGFGIGRQTDIAVLRRVFPAQNVELIVGGASQVANTLRRVRERLKRTGLRQAIEQEMNEGTVEARLAKNSVDEYASDFDLPLTIRNGYDHLPVKLERIEIRQGRLFSSSGDSSSKEILCVLEGAAADAAIEPGKELLLKVKGSLQAESQGWHIGEAEQSYRASLVLVPVVRFLNETALDEIEVDPGRIVVNSPFLSVTLRRSYGTSYRTLIVALLAIAAAVTAVAAIVKRATRRREEISERQEERRSLAGKLKIWPVDEVEPDGSLDLASFNEQDLALVIADGGGLEVVSTGDESGEGVARVSGHLIGASRDDAESGKVEFQIEAAVGHRLAYESGGEMRPSSRTVLCDRDVIEIDSKWRLRYANERLRTRAEYESAQAGGSYNV
ncbi:MAG: VWA domain-containing protein [Blastocatellia bacterium]|nr:VWA domain-containing protein [Blastocatellia bacterium]